MNWQGIKDFMVKAFSENGSPSSARIISGWLSVSSMSLLWWMVKHMMALQDNAKLMTWAGLFPNAVLSLGVFTCAPFGIAKAGQAAMAIWKKGDDGEPKS